MAKSKPPKVGQPESKTINDWSGGMNDIINPTLLNDNESPMLKNVSLDEKGTLYPAKGREERYQQDFSDSAIKGLGAYYKSDGTSRLVICTENKMFTDAPHLTNTFDTDAKYDAGSFQNTYVKDDKVFVVDEFPLCKLNIKPRFSKLLY